jgi:small subunit ribosomal protein S21
MIEVDVTGNGGIERALKTLKRKFNNLGIVRELRKRRHYTKPSIQRREEILAARYREAHRQDSE